MEKNNFKCNFDPKLRRKIQIWDTLISLLIIGLSLFFLFSFNFLKLKITSEILVYGGLGVFLASGFIELVPNILSPFLIIALSLSSGFGILFSVVSCLLGSLLGGLIGFFIGRTYGWRFICPLFSEKNLKKIVWFWSNHGKFFVFISAFTPVPYFPLIFGAMGMSWKDISLYGFLPRILGIILFAIGYYYGII